MKVSSVSPVFTLIIVLGGLLGGMLGEGQRGEVVGGEEVQADLGPGLSRG